MPAVISVIIICRTSRLVVVVGLMPPVIVKCVFIQLRHSSSAVVHYSGGPPKYSPCRDEYDEGYSG